MVCYNWVHDKSIVFMGVINVINQHTFHVHRAARRAPGKKCVSGQVKFLRQEGAEDLLMVLLDSWQIFVEWNWIPGWNWKKTWENTCRMMFFFHEPVEWNIVELDGLGKNIGKTPAE